IVKNDDVLRVAEKIVQMMEAAIFLDDGVELQVTVSMGLSFFPDDASDAETLLKHADEAMYSAKHLGRNNFQIYEISPAVFIPLAEETGLIVSIGEWVMHTACRQAREWEQRYGLRLRLGVNLSAVQLMEPQLLEMVAKVLRETGLDPTLLEMEITESISIKAAPNLVE